MFLHSSKTFLQSCVSLVHLFFLKKITPEKSSSNPHKSKAGHTINCSNKAQLQLKCSGIGFSAKELKAIMQLLLFHCKSISHAQQQWWPKTSTTLVFMVGVQDSAPHSRSNFPPDGITGHVPVSSNLMKPAPPSVAGPALHSWVHACMSCCLTALIFNQLSAFPLLLPFLHSSYHLYPCFVSANFVEAKSWAVAFSVSFVFNFDWLPMCF